MKPSLRLILMAFAIMTSFIMLTSCGDDEPQSTYYVKYEITTSSIYVYNNVEVVVTTENGVETKSVPRNWEGTFGPIDKNTQIILKVSYQGSGMEYVPQHTNFTGRISISKNNSPFVLKAESSSSSAPLSMSYLIDF